MEGAVDRFEDRQDVRATRLRRSVLAMMDGRDLFVLRLADQAQGLESGHAETCDLLVVFAAKAHGISPSSVQWLLEIAIAARSSKVLLLHNQAALLIVDERL